ncbi:MAG: ribulose bisphosphate carboxylase small subunit [Azospira oryzae]|uniref:Ribulose bisphosphate carboxylase small subunit n=1 Tax=Pelomicrobium methylotrophicum TaxID=2602750 RepID=A0A5C7EFF4_9PROT|nr:ribulose bisphosphate carboxylase small subunit [Pelomicrobium methylotrophicum]PZP57564.1 MAG: ribulose bisphosphate carboxylase small subunit [Azospira oryzae]PZP79118.1 MAG: ribulose bisphosphate carboxylase small subunit [Azospira oryzae]TXF10943.1 ribulose bisphosphate carboxylase small subunit [Pelomicrobium methylotrophicum]
MPEIQPYKPTERRGETFSYLPSMTPDKIRKQIQYLVNQGWNPAIEHTEPEKAFSHYWYLWKLPFFGETSVERIMAELESCHRANPGHLVRLIGYDNYTQSQGMAFIVYRGGR